MHAEHTFLHARGSAGRHPTHLDSATGRPPFPSWPPPTPTLCPSLVGWVSTSPPLRLTPSVYVERLSALSSSLYMTLFFSSISLFL